MLKKKAFCATIKLLRSNRKGNKMWALFAFGSAVFAGITAILAKIGVKDTDSDVATALRTIVVLLFSWLMVLVAGSANTLSSVSGRTLLFLILSGFATGASWLCYFKALQLGDVNRVTPIDKSSTVLSMLLAFLFLGESITVLKLISMAAILTGTLLMIVKHPGEIASPRRGWLLFAVGSAVFAALTSILGKIGIEGVESSLGTAIRTGVVLLLAWGIVFAEKKQKQVNKIDGKSLLFLVLSGITTGLSWLAYYRALQTGPASVVVPIDKLSILLTIAFSRLFLKERLTKKAAGGLALIVAGTLLLLIKN